MKPLLIAVCATCILSGAAAALAADAEADDDEYEEVVVRRKKKKTEAKMSAEQPKADATPVTTQVAVMPVVVVPAVVAVPVATPNQPGTADAKADDEPPPPPEPPAADAAEPRRLVRYFCKAWKDKDYERLWWAMSSKYREKVSLKKFKKLFASDAEMNGGLLDENIIETAKTKDGNEAVKVELIFKFPKAKHRFVMAVAERQPGGAFRIVDSPFIPQDLDDL